MKLKMGELSKMSGIAITTILYYEKAGLLQASWRTSGRFRLYDDCLLDRLRFIRICRQQGLDYKEIKELLDAMDRAEEGNCLSASWLDELIKKTENEIYLLKLHLKELNALKAASMRPNSSDSKLAKNSGQDNTHLNCKDLAE